MKSGRAVFVYQDHEESSVRGYEDWGSYIDWYSSTCPYCGIQCETDGEWGQEDWKFAFCRRCGWWSYHYDYEEPTRKKAHDHRTSQRAILRRFLDTSADIPVRELASYLNLNRERLGSIDPGKYQELVAHLLNEVMENSVVEHCSYGRPDKGIDIVCLNLHSGERVAVQVIRDKHPIEVGFVQQFHGAMINRGFTSGIIVTTSKFQKDCEGIRLSSEVKGGIHIDLIDGKRFLEFLEIYNADNKSSIVKIPDGLLNDRDLRRIANNLGLRTQIWY